MKKHLKWFIAITVIAQSACQKLPTLGENFYGVNYNSETLTWIFSDGNGSEGINRDTIREGSAPRSVSFNGKLYVSWVEFNGTANQLRVKVMTGTAASPSWQFVDGAGTNGLNKDSTKATAAPQIAVFAGRLYVAWHESDGATTQIRVAVYNGNDTAPSWSFVDGAAATGINKATGKDAELPNLFVFNNTLYAAWHEKGTGNFLQIRVASYNGVSTWTFVDGNLATGINKNITQDAQGPQLFSIHNKLFASWHENSATANKNQIRVAVWDGASSWSFADGNDANSGLNRDTSRAAVSPIPVVFAGKLYLGWQEFAGSPSQIRITVYTGNGTTHSWAFVDGGGFNGINKDVTKDAVRFTPFVYNNKLYTTFSEANQSLISHIRVAAYNGSDSAPAWFFADGNGPDGLNKDKTREAIRPFAIVHNSEIYLTWSEENSIFKKSIRVISGK